MTPRQYEERYDDPVGRCSRHNRAVLDNQCDECDTEQAVEMEAEGQARCDWCGKACPADAGAESVAEQARGCAKCLSNKLDDKCVTVETLSRQLRKTEAKLAVLQLQETIFGCRISDLEKEILK